MRQTRKHQCPLCVTLMGRRTTRIQAQGFMSWVSREILSCFITRMLGRMQIGYQKPQRPLASDVEGVEEPSYFLTLSINHISFLFFRTYSNLFVSPR